jgi:hypothetical protein
MTEVGIRDEFVQENHSLFPAAMSCADCTIKLAARRGNWSAWWPTKSLMSQWICAAAHPHLDAGTV